MRSYYEEDEEDEYSYEEMMLMRRGDPSMTVHRPLTSSTNHLSSSSYIQPEPVSRANSEDNRFDAMCLEDLDIIKTIGKCMKSREPDYFLILDLNQTRIVPTCMEQSV